MLFVNFTVQDQRSTKQQSVTLLQLLKLHQLSQSELLVMLKPQEVSELLLPYGQTILEKKLFVDSTRTGTEARRRLSLNMLRNTLMNNQKLQSIVILKELRNTAKLSV